MKNIASIILGIITFVYSFIYFSALDSLTLLGVLVGGGIFLLLLGLCAKCISLDDIDDFLRN